MVHVTVGTANAVCALMNAARDNVPVILAAGRTPLTETGHAASRNRSIHWGQEMFDQGGLAREFVKWDYELRAGQPAGIGGRSRARHRHVGAARAGLSHIAREVLADPAVAPRRDTVRPLGASAAVPSSEAVERAAAILSAAEFPLIPDLVGRPQPVRHGGTRPRWPSNSPFRCAIGSARHQPADRSSHVPRLRSGGAARLAMRLAVFRQRGAGRITLRHASSAQGDASPSLPRQDPLSLPAIAVTRIRGGFAGRIALESA